MQFSRKVLEAMERLQGNEDYKVLMAFLKETVVDEPVMSANHKRDSEVFYLLGRQDMIKTLLQSLSDDVQDELQTIQEMYDERRNAS